MSLRLDGRNPLAYMGVRPITPPQLVIDNRRPVTTDVMNFELGTLWVIPELDTTPDNEVWILLSKQGNAATWVKIYPATASGDVVMTITGDTGGAVGPDAGGNINILGTTDVIAVTGDIGTNTLTISAGASLATMYTADTGSAAPAANNLNVVGGSGITTSGAGDTITISQGADVPTSFTTDDANSAVPASNNLNVFGGAGITTSSAGDTITIDLDTPTPLSFATDSGTATETANTINILGGTNIATSGATDEVTISIDGTIDVTNGGTGATSFTPYTVITAGTTATGALTNVSGVGTAGQILTSNGAAMYPTWQDNSGGSAFSSVVTQIFTTSDTYTPTADMKYCIVEVVGGGGGGGRSSSCAAGQGSGGSAGGGGGYARSVLDAATVGASQVVTIGAGGTGQVGGTPATAGGTTSFGALVVATGGSFGGAGSATSTFKVGGGSSGGVGTSGDFLLNGGQGWYYIATSTNSMGGNGGRSYYSQGSTQTSVTSGTVNGGAATGYGGGGGGAASQGSASATTGGAGSAGICIVTEYI